MARCVAMLAHLYHAPQGQEPCGAATVGCTEATLLSGLAAKKLWQARRRQAGQPADKPNLIIGANYQVEPFLHQNVRYCLRALRVAQDSLQQVLPQEQQLFGCTIAKRLWLLQHDGTLQHAGLGTAGVLEEVLRLL